VIPNTLLVLLLCNFVAIGLLPILFFRNDGSYNARWLTTSAPFFVVPVLLILGAVDVLHLPSFVDSQPLELMQIVAVALSVASIGLLALTVGSHRVPLALWHQDNDAPVHLVTWGPYARIRHPFYTSFLLALTAALLTFPHILTAASLAYGLLVLTITARREEQRLASSEFGAEYRDYISVSGRFLPRLGS
jgi:protein-S-isoprenylcysteine O-methyltransferase Ste14